MQAFTVNILQDPIQWFFFIVFISATPLSIIAAFILKYDKAIVAIWNSYALSTSFFGLYFTPLLSPYSKMSFQERLHVSTLHWILFLTCFTEVLIQIPHNLLPKQLHEQRGSVSEWPFYAYGFCDFRWYSYSQDSFKTFSLPEEVTLINWNDGLFGVLILVLLFLHAVPRLANVQLHTKLLILCTVFRDATLWRETVEYMLQHHRSNYSFTTHDSRIRAHAIANLWAINILWILAPMMTVVWATQQLCLPAGKQHSKLE